MIGLVIALLWAGCVAIFGDASGPDVFLSATNFLFWWYVVTSAIIGVVIACVSLLMTGGGTAVGAAEGRGVAGGLAGFALGGAVSGLLVLVFAIQRGLLMGGAYLLSTGVTVTDGTPVWNTTKLVIGGLMLFVALFVRGRSSSSSSSSGSRAD